jgi:hypothetical protein
MLVTAISIRSFLYTKLSMIAFQMLHWVYNEHCFIRDSQTRDVMYGQKGRKLQWTFMLLWYLTRRVYSIPASLAWTLPVFLSQNQDHYPIKHSVKYLFALSKPLFDPVKKLLVVNSFSFRSSGYYSEIYHRICLNKIFEFLQQFFS